MSTQEQFSNSRIRNKIQAVTEYVFVLAVRRTTAQRELCSTGRLERLLSSFPRRCLLSERLHFHMRQQQPVVHFLSTKAIVQEFITRQLEPATHSTTESPTTWHAASSRSRTLPLGWWRTPDDATTSRQFYSSCTGFQCDSSSSLRSPHWSNRRCLGTRLTTVASLLTDAHPRKLHSAETWTLLVSRKRIDFGNWAHSVAGPRFWNYLPIDLRHLSHSRGTSSWSLTVKEIFGTDLYLAGHWTIVRRNKHITGSTRKTYDFVVCWQSAVVLVSWQV